MSIGRKRPARRSPGHRSRLYVRDSAFRSTVLRSAVANAGPAQRAQRPGRRRAGLRERRHGGADCRGARSFPGLRRRLEVLGTGGASTLVDDYAHHPTEVTAALAAIRDVPRRRVWCVFQPHQASRTARLLDELAASLQNADKVLVAEIFVPARAVPGRGRSRRPIWPGGPRRLASRCCRAMRRKKSSERWKPTGPRRRIGYARGGRRGKAAASVSCQELTMVAVHAPYEKD